MNPPPPPISLSLLSQSGQGRSIVHGGASVPPIEPYKASLPPRFAGTPNTCGEILEAVAKVIASKPPYLPGESVPRHLGLLDRLLGARYEVLGVGSNLSGPVRAEPLDRFGVVLRLWIDSFLYRDEASSHPLLAVCAFDTVLTALAIAFGGSQKSVSGTPWSLAGLFQPPQNDAYRLARLYLPSYRRTVIGQLADRWVVLRVPEGASIDVSCREPIQPDALAMLLVSPTEVQSLDTSTTFELKHVRNHALMSRVSIPGLLEPIPLQVSANLSDPAFRHSTSKHLAVPARFDAAGAFVPLDWIIATAAPADATRSNWTVSPLPWCK